MTKTLIVNIDGPDEARWSVEYYTTSYKTYPIANNLISGYWLKDLTDIYQYKIKFTEIEGYKNPGIRIIDLNSYERPQVYVTFSYIKLGEVVDEDIYSFVSPLKTKSVHKPIIYINDVDLDLSVRTKNFYTLLENSAFTPKHHFESNSLYYSIPSIGKISLFLKNFEKYTVNPYLLKRIPNMSFYTVPKEEENRLDLISWYFYKTPELFWIIMAINDIIDPFDVKEGTVLKIPPKDFIEFELIRKEVID